MLCKDVQSQMISVFFHAAREISKADVNDAFTLVNVSLNKRERNITFSISFHTEDRCWSFIFYPSLGIQSIREDVKTLIMCAKTHTSIESIKDTMAEKSKNGLNRFYKRMESIKE